METVSIIIPQFGMSELTRSCVTSFLHWHQQTEFDQHLEIIIVDDGSAPWERRHLHQLPTAVRVVANAKNRGTTAAWNLGLQHALGNIFVLLNNDVVSRGDWLSALIEPLHVDPAQLCGVALREESDLPEQITASRGNSRLLDGWCLAFWRSAAQQVGNFDERMRLYFSDTDWQCRWIQNFGPQALRPVLNLPLAHASHLTANTIPDKRCMWHRDRNYFLRKWA